MKVFISYSHSDKDFAERLANTLRAEGIDVWIDLIEINVGDNLFKIIESGIHESDYIIVVLSRSSSKSQWVQKEVSTFAMKEVSDKSIRILPVLIEDTEIPVFFRDRLFADFRSSFSHGINSLLKTLKRKEPEIDQESRDNYLKEIKESSLEIQIKKIHTEFVSGNLCLFCGAGISVAAGIPKWSLLLNTLLGSLFEKEIPKKSSPQGLQNKLADLYQDYFNPSSLMIAQYLKNGLGNDFLKHIRQALYQNHPTSSSLLESIVELCRPQRAKRALHSIITFNFDDIIEDNLRKNHIQYRSIFAEGQRNAQTELPIYHVHGFLPRSGALTSQHEVVFAEDAYHSQFIDSFSWSNLIQLNHLNNKLCLFVGLSLTDPNLRRLLDVSMRKKPDRTLNHYVFKKTYNALNILDEMKMRKIDEHYSLDFIKIASLLEEQDANNLGLNVIWVDDYAEIPDIIKRIQKGR